MPLVTFVALIQLMDNFRVFEPIVGFNAAANKAKLGANAILGVSLALAKAAANEVGLRAAVITIFYGFFNKKINSKLATYSIICGLISGLLFFPSQNFQSSILVGNLISIENFSILIKTNLLFISFFISLIVPFLMIFIYFLRNSFK